MDQWVEFAKNELDLPVGMWIYPILGFIPTNATNTKQAQEDLKRALAVLDAHLQGHTFLVGESASSHRCIFTAAGPCTARAACRPGGAAVCTHRTRPTLPIRFGNRIFTPFAALHTRIVCAASPACPIP